MIFEIEHKGYGKSRQGILKNLNRSISDIQTPMAMSYTRGGLLSLITKDLYTNMASISNIAHIPLSTVYRNKDAIAKCEQSINKFASITEFVSYISVQDAAEISLTGQNTKKSVAISGRNGKVDISPVLFMDCIEVLRPDWIQALADSDTSINNSGDGITRKRLRKSVERSLSFLDSCIEIKNKSKDLVNTEIFGVIEGGYRSQDRIYSAKETSKRDVAGFSIEGFHNYYDESLKLENIYELLCEFMNELPENKPRLLHGGYNAENILLAVEAGIDIFDSVYTYSLSVKGIALFMDYSLESTQKLDLMDMNDIKYKNDQTALDNNCSCLTCRKHTRAYCCHLLITNELLSGILLMIHNTYQYQLFFSQIRNALKSPDVQKNTEKSSGNEFQALKTRAANRLKNKITM